MTRRTIEGSVAIAETVRNCIPDVVACYPITPSTHIAEELAQIYADGEIKEYIAVESEFAAISALIGASAAGARTFSTTSSQGLALMHEVLFTVAGMRLPVVMVVANRALSSPLNIWNDHQDTISERDSGWVQLYCESNQEAVDAIPQAYKIAESVNLPVMVNVDGFYLTHSVEQIEVPTCEKIKEFLPAFSPDVKLDSAKPLSLGVYAFPEHYQSFREDVDKDLNAAQTAIVKAHDEWRDLTNRRYGNGLWEEVNLENADYVFIGMGSVMGNVKSVVQDYVKDNCEEFGAIRLRSYRPFPEKIVEKLKGKRAIAVFEKALSLGSGGSPPLFAEITSAMQVNSVNGKVSSFIGGLGGKDVTRENIRGIFSKLKTEKAVKEFL
ncbi:MAG: pyruvate ferredoxin oxidoreductase [Candidatus Micrarchaeota archaeon]